MIKDYKRFEYISFRLGELKVLIDYNKQSKIYVEEQKDLEIELQKLKKKLNLID